MSPTQPLLCRRCKLLYVPNQVAVCAKCFLAARNQGHGHVRPRPDRFLAPCGGPGVCMECSLEAAPM
jgi:hypothetical protein